MYAPNRAKCGNTSMTDRTTPPDNTSPATIVTNDQTDLMWSEPVPKLSSPHRDSTPESIRLPKYFQPVGTSYTDRPFSAATLQ